MERALLNHIAKFVTLDEAENILLLQHLEFLTVKKKALLLEAGQICHSQYFVVRGCCRSYIINDKGGEQTTQFAIENWWITDYLSFDSQKPSIFHIQAVENTDVIAITKHNMEILLAKIPKLERYFRIIMQKAFGASQVRIKYLFTMSAEERYHHINNLFPEFVQRVPQYMLATYLDFSPEFMSKIRAGLDRKRPDEAKAN
jgi:CRP/FNR family transcriptional regulator, anaerobic regulatory protein